MLEDINHTSNHFSNIHNSINLSPIMIRIVAIAINTISALEIIRLTEAISAVIITHDQSI